MNAGSSAAELVDPSPAAPGGLDISGVTVRFGGLTALDDVSLGAVPRQVTGIIGPNGAGKTTLLNASCGFVRPQSGKITFNGHDLTGIRPHRLAGLGIARTLQGVGLFRGLSVVENVMVGATHLARAGFWSGFFGLPRSDRDERRLREEALQALSRVGVHDLADSMPETLAYGLRKRVALARALVGHPRLLLLDEPASGLSEKELPELGDLIKSLADEASVVVIEHRMDLVMSVCDAIFVLDFGRLIATGTPEQVQADPAVTAAYLGSEENVGAAGEGPAAARAEEAGHE
ncbi:MAG TPA: ABC transporter ATP-binding protein [Streptosporangiaceae bacterium]|nr:ABC transporter ATP-binding protein [Streptosporangiaceae bacterium]